MLISQIGGSGRARSSGLPMPRLPLDRQHSAGPHRAHARQSVELSTDLAGSCARLAHDAGTSVRAVVLAALAAFMHRYTGAEAIVIGLVQPDDDALARFTIEPGLPFETVLTQAAATLAITDGRSQPPAKPLPTMLLADGMTRPGDMPQHLPVLFASVQATADDPASDGPVLDGDASAESPNPLATTGGDLLVALVETAAGQLALDLSYDPAALDHETVRRMGRHLRVLLEAALREPARPVGALSLLDPADARQIETRWNQTERPIPATTLHAEIAAQADRMPQATAIQCNDLSWTYQELDREACRIAARLRRLGVGHGTLVALCLDRTPQMIAGLLGILKTGAAYLPLDPAFTAGRLAMIIEDAEPAVLLTRRALQASLPEQTVALLLLDDPAEAGSEDDGLAGADDPAAAVFEPVAPDCLAYVLYTSGSTGRPKGVEVTHRNVMNFLAAMRERPGFFASDVLLAVTTISFDIAVLELFLPLLSGGVVVLASRDDVVDPYRLSALMAASGCTVMQATPSLWRSLVESGWKGAPTLRILCGGEAMPRELADALLSGCDSLWNMYGPTETTVWSTVQQVQAGSASPIIPVGQPIGNTRTYILDDGGEVCPVGVAGELFIGGAGVARGYRNKPELTAERFIDSRFVPGDRLYRTGDLVRLRADGAIEWLTRRDNQVKIRGHRIEVQEIEAALERHLQVRAAAVRTWPDVAGQPALVAYVSLREIEPDLTQLRVFLRDTLPDYMIPARFVVLDRLPLTQNGKLDRNALPEPERLVGRAVTSATGGGREREIAAIWEELLGASAIGLHDSFFELGGDSLKAVTLLMRIEATFGRRLTLAALFQNPTIASTAALLAEPAAEITLPLATEIQPDGDRTALFWIDGGPMFLPLANAMGRERPFLGVTLMPHELAEVGFQPDLQTIARHLVGTIRKIRPHGPYLIGGYCAGGILAYEVASQLMQDGEQVPLLCLIDAENPTTFRRVGSLGVEMAKLRHHLGALLHTTSGSRVAYVRRHATSAWRRIMSRGEWKAVMRSEPFTLGEIMQPAADAYHPGLYPGAVALFQARRPKQLDLRPGWAQVVSGQLDAYDFPGAHGTMLEPPQVHRLAELINRRLEEVD